MCSNVWHFRVQLREFANLPGHIYVRDLDNAALLTDLFLIH